MDYRDLEKLTEKVGSKYKLATLIMKRLRELQHGAPPLIENASGMKYEDIVVREILEDKIELLTGKAAENVLDEMRMEELASTPVQWTDNLLTRD